MFKRCIHVLSSLRTTFYGSGRAATSYISIFPIHGNTLHTRGLQNTTDIHNAQKQPRIEVVENSSGDKKGLSAINIYTHINLANQKHYISHDSINFFLNLCSVTVKVSWDEMIKNVADEVLQCGSVGDLEVLLPTEWCRCFAEFRSVGLNETLLTTTLIHYLLIEAGERNSPALAERILIYAVKDRIVSLTLLDIVLPLLWKLKGADGLRLMCAYLDALGSLNVYLSKHTVEDIHRCLESFGKWNGKYVQIDRSGYCPNCKQQLQELCLTEDELQNLKSHIVSDIVKDDKFFQAFPEAINDLINFVGSAGYSYVFDHQSMVSSIGTVQYKNLISQLSEKENILITGKKSHFSYKTTPFFWERVDSVVVPKTSELGHYLIIAALFSEDIKLITNNEFKMLLKWMKDKPYINQFKTWLLLHRSWFQHEVELKKWTLLPSVNYAPIVQRTATTVHLPCSADGSEKFSFSHTDHWMCLKLDDLSEKS